MPTITRPSVQKERQNGLRPYFQKSYTNPKTGKTKNGFWFCEIRDHQGKKNRYRLGVSEPTKTNAGEAAAWQALLEIKGEIELAHPKNGEQIKVANCCQERLGWIKDNMSVRTFDQNQHTLKMFCAMFGDKAVSELTADDINAFLDTQKNWNDSTRRKGIDYIQAAINHCCERQEGDPRGVVRLGWIKVNPVRNMEKPVVAARRDYFTRKELASFMRHADPHYRRIVWLAYRTGARLWSEVAKITADHAIEMNGRLVLRFDEHKTKRKTGKPIYVHLPKPVERVIRSRMKRKPKGLLFANTKGSQYNDNNGALAFRRAIKRAKASGNEWRGHLVAHNLRDSFIIECLRQGASIEQTAALAHDSADVLRKHYAGLDGDQGALGDIMERMGRRNGK